MVDFFSHFYCVAHLGFAFIAFGGSKTIACVRSARAIGTWYMIFTAMLLTLVDFSGFRNSIFSKLLTMKVSIKLLLCLLLWHRVATVSPVSLCLNTADYVACTMRLTALLLGCMFFSTAKCTAMKVRTDVLCRDVIMVKGGKIYGLKL